MRPAQTNVFLTTEPVVSAPAESPLSPATMLPAQNQNGGGQAVPDAHMANAPTVRPGDADRPGPVVDGAQTSHAGVVSQAVAQDRSTPIADMLPPENERANGAGHLWSDTHTPDAGSTITTDDADGRTSLATQSSGADASSPDTVQVAGLSPSADTKTYIASDLDLLHAALGHYARVFGDLQKTRVAMDNRAAAMERDGLPEEWIAVTRSQAESLKKSERAVASYLRTQARRHPLASWIEQQRGISLAGFARLIGITGPLSRFGTISKLWRYLGLAVDDGQAPKRRKGERLNYSPSGRVLCRQIADAIVKVGAGGEYRQVYDDKKAYYEAERPDWTPMRRHAAAMRYAVKRLLRRMWLRWRVLQREGLLP